MKYTILSLENPERRPLVDAINRQMSPHYQGVYVDAVDGKTEALNEAIDFYGFDINFDEWKPGEGGVWYSNINAWKRCVELDEDLLVFEDDAILHPNFVRQIQTAGMPESYDFITYYNPHRHNNQTNRLSLATCVQEHGMVAIRYSPRGAARCLEILENEGLEWPVDIWLFKLSKFRGLLEGYGPHHNSRIIVDHNFDIPSNIHGGDRIPVHKPRKKQ